MEAAIRWSAASDTHSQRFLIADVSKNELQYGEVESVSSGIVDYRIISRREKLPNFTAFDWSKTNEAFVAIGTGNGDARVIRIDPEAPPGGGFVHSFSIKTPRKCNSIAFSTQDLLATGLDRTRADPSLNIYDLRNPSVTAEPTRRLSGTEVVSNVKFFATDPQVLLAGISKQCIRLYDLRDSSTSGAAVFPTRNVHFLSIDPLDENQFASAGPAGDNIVCVWDKRWVARADITTLAGVQLSTPVLEIRPTIDTSMPANIWSLRYSGYRRGSFGVLSSSGQIRLLETAQAWSLPTYQPLTISNLNDTSCTHYMKQTRDLQSACNIRDAENGVQRPIAFDFVHSGLLCDGESILTVRQNRLLEVVPIPAEPSVVRFTPTHDLAIHGSSYSVTKPINGRNSIANDLIEIQIRARQKTKLDEVATDEGKGILKDAGRDALNQRSPSDKETAKLSSRERHLELQHMAFPVAKLSHEDMLTISTTARRRCQEGYLFDCEMNKAIVKNDPWLVDLWENIKRLEDLARQEGMASDAVDLGYLGVYHLWTAKLGPNSNRLLRRSSNSSTDVGLAIKHIRWRHSYPAFEGVQTSFPDHRQLCLAICGWRFSESRLREKCEDILNRGDSYKAIAVAVCHGRKDIALSLLRTLLKEKKLQNIGLGAILATETVSKEQQQLCAWMAEESDDPYLTMLLTHYVTGDWGTVVAMTELPLLYRVAVALKFLGDEALSTFLEAATLEAVETGDTEGIVLTGLSELSMDLFQNYISRFGDLQTAVLATAFTNPLFVDDVRWNSWKETYFMDMQKWRAFIERTRFTVQHNRKAVTHSGRKLVHPPPRQVTLRCNHCHSALARYDREADLTDDEASTVSGIVPQKGSLAAAGTVCPKCDRPMPRCGICMMWLGTPDPKRPSGAAALAKSDIMAKFITFCMACGHGCHSHHARDWFNKHQMCPVPDCQCLCGIK